MCSLIHYVRSWASDRDDSAELGAEQLNRWWEAVSRGMDFRARVGSDRFADLSFADLQVDPVGAIATAYEQIDMDFPASSRDAVTTWASSHEPGAHGTHAYDLADFGLDADQVRERFAPYIESYEAERVIRGSQRPGEVERHGSRDR